MKIPVCGFDPSLTNWGIAEAVLDLDNGYLSTPTLSLIQPKDGDGKKQVRRNSLDLSRAEELVTAALASARRAKVVFVEVPHGSQSARAMASYGICIGVLASIRAAGIELIEVSATENKFNFTGNKTATKEQMIATAVQLYPDANFPMHNGKLSAAKAEHGTGLHGSIPVRKFHRIDGGSGYWSGRREWIGFPADRGVSSVPDGCVCGP